MMTEEHALVGLDSMMGGEVVERFRYEHQRVVENIADPNTTLKKRVIDIKFEMEPNKSRTQFKTTATITTKLANTEQMETTVFISRLKSGLVASEYNLKEPFLPEVMETSTGTNTTSLTSINGGRTTC